ncbi:hypothetical protein BSL78_23319 [Apostichopus japonicus]|uniref:EGF-like domain-containing protein n=1 Tax=Stichopus japonicus TaxID=307972 RepID=A0A2G8JVR2_STIJA|nr:hypothetical protein BSL78_23319 [Apostichopus japonicus]
MLQFPTFHSRITITSIIDHSTVDADECAAKPGPCEQICDNILGGYECSCRKGYSLSLDDRTTCLDEDECELNTHNCDENAFCTNTEGSFQCNCTDGYYGDGFNCTDVNECEEDTHDCDTHATCHDNNGGYSCTCNPGWTGSGEMHTCSVSYCENSPCHTFADCIDGDESYVCVCQDGFVGNGYECTFVDACEAGLHDCDMAEYVCVRNQSSYYCQCLEGYEEVNGTCKGQSYPVIRYQLLIEMSMNATKTFVIPMLLALTLKQATCANATGIFRRWILL